MANKALEEFDLIIGQNAPEVAEEKLKGLLTKCDFHSSLRLQILSQVALAQALQRKFIQAHGTLNSAEEGRESTGLARVRILLERGRVLYQESLFGALDKNNKEDCRTKAEDFFLRAYELALNHEYEFYAADAAHMLGIVSLNAEEKIRWNAVAVEISESSEDERTRKWVSALYNNLGQNYLELNQNEAALEAFQRALALKKKEGGEFFIWHATWAVAHTLRLLGRMEKAQFSLEELARQIQKPLKNVEFSVPQAMLKNLRGLIFEDLAEVYSEKVRLAAQTAYRDLSEQEWARLEQYQPRIDRLEHMSKFAFIKVEHSEPT